MLKQNHYNNLKPPLNPIQVNDTINNSQNFKPDRESFGIEANKIQIRRSIKNQKPSRLTKDQLQNDYSQRANSDIDGLVNM